MEKEPREQTLRVSDHFGDWVRVLWKRWNIPIFGIATTVVVQVLMRVLPKALSQDWAIWAVPSLLGFQALYITLLLFIIPTPMTNTRLVPRASRAAEQFLWAWRKMWLFWGFVYLGMVPKALWDAHLLAYGMCSEQIKFYYLTHPVPWAYIGVAENFLNNLQTIALIMCYVVLSRKTVDLKRSDDPLPWECAVGILVVVTFIQLVAAFAWQHNLTKLGEGGCNFITWITGLAAGVSLALFVGRLDSKLICPPVFVVAVLYLYAAMQTGWAAFSSDTNAKVLFTNAALLLKTVLFLLVAWLLRTGVLLFYLDRVAKTYDNVAADRNAFIRELQQPTD